MKRRCGLCHRLFDDIEVGEHCPTCGGFGFKPGDFETTRRNAA